MIFDMNEMILPSPHQAFEWRRSSSHETLVCAPLERYAPHFFSTRAWKLGASRSPADDDEGWAEIAAAMDVEPKALVRVRQVHGNAVVVARRNSPLTEADVVVTDDPARAIAVQGADCVPLLVADVTRGVVAAAHAGWRGMTKRVPASTVAGLARAYRSKPEDLVVAVGPSIGACCYQVGQDVRDSFAAAGFSPSQLDRWFLARPAERAANPPMPTIERAVGPGRWFLDLWAVAREQLEAAGVQPDRIFAAELCTASHPETLCSYRRDGREAGRLAAAIKPVRPASVNRRP